MDKERPPSSKIANSTKNSKKKKDPKSANSPSVQDVKVSKSTSMKLNQSDMPTVSISQSSIDNNKKNESNKKSKSHSDQGQNSEVSPHDAVNIPNVITTAAPNRGQRRSSINSKKSISSLNSNQPPKSNSLQFNNELNTLNLNQDFTNLSSLINASDNATTDAILSDTPGVNSTNTLVKGFPSLTATSPSNEKSILMPSMLSSIGPSVATTAPPLAANNQGLPIRKPAPSNNASESMSQSFEHNAAISNSTEENNPISSKEEFNLIRNQLFNAAKIRYSKPFLSMDADKLSSQTSTLLPTSEYETEARAASNEVVSLVAIKLTKSELALRQRKPPEQKSSTVTMTGVRIRRPVAKKPTEVRPKPKFMQPLPGFPPIDAATTTPPQQEMQADIFTNNSPTPPHTASVPLGDFKLGYKPPDPDFDARQSKTAVSAPDTIFPDLNGLTDSVNIPSNTMPSSTQQYSSNVEGKTSDPWANLPSSMMVSNNQTTEPMKINTNSDKGRNQCKRNPIMDVLITMDATKSMDSMFQEFRKHAFMACVRHVLSHNTPTSVAGQSNASTDIRIGVIVHGDYADNRRNCYVTRMVDFTSDLDVLSGFTKGIYPVSGSDCGNECYEFVLRISGQLNSTESNGPSGGQFSWRKNSTKVMIMIGDSLPHDSSHPNNTKQLKWQQELEYLKLMAVQVHSLQCYDDPKATSFWRHLATIGGGNHLNLYHYPELMSHALISTILVILSPTIYKNYEISILRETINNEHKRNAFRSLLKSVDTGTGSDEAMECSRITETTKTEEQITWETQHPTYGSDTFTDVILALDTSQGMSLAVDSLVVDSGGMADSLFAGTSGLRLKIITHSCGDANEALQTSRCMRHPHQLKTFLQRLQYPAPVDTDPCLEQRSYGPLFNAVGKNWPTDQDARHEKRGVSSSSKLGDRETSDRMLLVVGHSTPTDSWTRQYQAVIDDKVAVASIDCGDMSSMFFRNITTDRHVILTDGQYSSLSSAIQAIVTRNSRPRKSQIYDNNAESGNALLKSLKRDEPEDNERRKHSLVRDNDDSDCTPKSAMRDEMPVAPANKPSAILKHPQHDARKPLPTSGVNCGPRQSLKSCKSKISSGKNRSNYSQKVTMKNSRSYTKSMKKPWDFYAEVSQFSDSDDGVMKRCVKPAKRRKRPIIKTSSIEVNKKQKTVHIEQKPSVRSEIAVYIDSSEIMEFAVKSLLANFKELIARLDYNVPNMYIAILTSVMEDGKPEIVCVDFTDNFTALHDFLMNLNLKVSQRLEYSAIFNKVSYLSWTKNSKRQFVLMSASSPTSVVWKQEINVLKEAGIKCYGISYADSLTDLHFWTYFSKETQGRHINLQNHFELTCLALMSCILDCFNQPALQAIEKLPVKNKERLGFIFNVQSRSVLKGLAHYSTTNLVKSKSQSCNSKYIKLALPTRTKPANKKSKCKQITVDNSEGCPVDVALCIEVNSSMLDLIYELSRELISVVIQLKKMQVNINVGILLVGTCKDLKCETFLPLTSNEKEINKYLDDLYVDLVLATNTDTYHTLDYHCNLLMAASSLNWRAGARRLVVIIGHGQFNCKDLRQSDSGKMKETAKMLKDKSIKTYFVKAMRTSSPTSDDINVCMYRHIGSQTSGIRFPIEKPNLDNSEIEEFTSFTNIKMICMVLLAIVVGENSRFKLQNYENMMLAQEWLDFDQKEYCKVMLKTILNNCKSQLKAKPCEDTSLPRMKKTKPKTPKKRNKKRNNCDSDKINVKRFKAENTLVIRDAVDEQDVDLDKLNWYDWLSLYNSRPLDNEDENWVKEEGTPGYRNIQAYSRVTHVPAVYEFGVDYNGCIYPVYVSATKGFTGVRVDSYFLRGNHIRQQVDALLRRGLSVKVRRCLDLKGFTPLEIKQHLISTYDYAWTLHGSFPGKHRKSTIGAFVISDPIRNVKNRYYKKNRNFNKLIR